MRNEIKLDPGASLTSKLKTVFFDLGQTLVTGTETSARRLLSQRLNLSEKETKRVGRMIMTHPATNPTDLSESVRGLLPDYDALVVREIVESVWSDQILCVREVPGATRLIEKLKEQGLKVGIISNTWHPFYEGFLTACRDIACLLDYTILSYRYGAKKPSVAIFKQAVDLCGENPPSICMVGDSYELDMIPAMEIGMKTVWILCRPEREKAALAKMLRGEIPTPDWSAGNLGETTAYLLNAGQLWQSSSLSS